MALRIICCIATLAVVHGSLVIPILYTSQAIHSTPIYEIAVPVVLHHPIYYAPAKYAFQYNVNDAHTGDVKDQHEEHNSDIAKGFYSLNEADGTKRIAQYTADSQHGFNAVLARKEHVTHPVTLKTTASVVNAGHSTQKYADSIAVAHHAIPHFRAHGN